MDNDTYREGWDSVEFDEGDRLDDEGYIAYLDAELRKRP